MIERPRPAYSTSIGSNPITPSRRLSALPRIALPTLERSEAEALVELGHRVCPYSNATRGNSAVRLVIDEPAPV